MFLIVISIISSVVIISIIISGAISANQKGNQLGLSKPDKNKKNAIIKEMDKALKNKK